MKKKMIVGIAMALGMLSVGAISASAAGPCCNEGKCSDKQAALKFTGETAELTSALKAKDLELRQQYTYEGIDLRKVNELEAELNELKGKIKVIAEKHRISTCCLS